jgi:hypothetical protein
MSTRPGLIVKAFAVATTQPQTADLVICEKCGLDKSAYYKDFCSLKL